MVGLATVGAATREAYAAVVAGFAGWLEDRGGGLDGPRARDLAARDYKRSLKLERGLGPASVNQALAALDHFCRFRGLGAATVQREELPRAALRALSVEEQRLLLRAAKESTLLIDPSSYVSPTTAAKTPSPAPPVGAQGERPHEDLGAAGRPVAPPSLACAGVAGTSVRGDPPRPLCSATPFPLLRR